MTTNEHDTDIDEGVHGTKTIRIGQNLLFRISALMSILVGTMFCFALGIVSTKRSNYNQIVLQRSANFSHGSNSSSISSNHNKSNSSYIHPNNTQNYFPVVTDHRRLLLQSSQQQKPHHHHQQQQQQQQQRDTTKRKLKRLQHEHVDCSMYEHTFAISDKIRINYVLNLDNDHMISHGGGNFSVEIIYQGQGWLGFAHSESGNMVGSVSMIGLPEVGETHQVQKYFLGGQDISNIQALPATHQTLINTMILQDDYKTIMRFTKLLVERDELTIHPNLQNTFLFAVGKSNEMGLHEERGVVVLDLKPCIPTTVQIGRDGTTDKNENRYADTSNNYVISVPGNIPSTLDAKISIGDDNMLPDPIYPLEDNASQQESTEEFEVFDIPGQFTVDEGDDLVLLAGSDSEKKDFEDINDSKIWWTLHGIFAAMTCGILLPVVIASSMLRGCFGGKVRKDQISDNKLYRWSNGFIIICVAVTFATAFVGAQKDASVLHLYDHDNDSNKQSPHGPFGLALFVLLMFYSLTGVLRSYMYLVLKPNALQDTDKEDKGSTPSDFNSVDVTSNNNGLATFIRRVWDRSHLFVGFILLFISSWQSKTGLDLYVDHFTNSWFGPTVYWSISGPNIGVVCFLCFFEMCYQILVWGYKTFYW